CRVTDERVAREAFPSMPKPLFSLNKEQKTLIRAFQRARAEKSRPYGTFCVLASTSTGKTVAQIEMARLLGQKTLVLCKSNLIRRSWQEDLFKYLGIHKEDVGIIQQKTWEIGDHFTLSSLATLARRTSRWHEIFAEFGTVVLDEMHNLPAQTIYGFLSACPALNVIGATAT